MVALRDAGSKRFSLWAHSTRIFLRRLRDIQRPIQQLLTPHKLSSADPLQVNLPAACYRQSLPTEPLVAPPRGEIRTSPLPHRPKKIGDGGSPGGAATPSCSNWPPLLAPLVLSPGERTPPATDKLQEIREESPSRGRSSVHKKAAQWNLRAQPSRIPPTRRMLPTISPHRAARRAPARRN